MLIDKYLRIVPHRHSTHYMYPSIHSCMYACIHAYMYAYHGRNLVGDVGTCPPDFFNQGGHAIFYPPPHFADDALRHFWSGHSGI